MIAALSMQVCRKTIKQNQLMSLIENDSPGDSRHLHHFSIWADYSPGFRSDFRVSSARLY